MLTKITLHYKTPKRRLKIGDHKTDKHGNIFERRQERSREGYYYVSNGRPSCEWVLISSPLTKDWLWPMWLGLAIREANANRCIPVEKQRWLRWWNPNLDDIRYMNRSLS